MQSTAAEGPGFDDPLGMAADWLTGDAPRPVRDPALPSGGVLVKRAKPGQDLRVDMPVIGPETVAGAARAGLRGVVIEAGSVMMLDRARCVALAEDAGLFLWVRKCAST